MKIIKFSDWWLNESHNKKHGGLGNCFVNINEDDFFDLCTTNDYISYDSQNRDWLDVYDDADKFIGKYSEITNKLFFEKDSELYTHFKKHKIQMNSRKDWGLSESHNEWSVDDVLSKLKDEFRHAGISEFEFIDSDDDGTRYDIFHVNYLLTTKTEYNKACKVFDKIYGVNDLIEWSCSYDSSGFDHFKNDGNVYFTYIVLFKKEIYTKNDYDRILKIIDDCFDKISIYDMNENFNESYDANTGELHLNFKLNEGSDKKVVCNITESELLNMTNYGFYYNTSDNNKYDYDIYDEPTEKLVGHYSIKNETMTVFVPSTLLQYCDTNSFMQSSEREKYKKFLDK